MTSSAGFAGTCGWMWNLWHLVLWMLWKCILYWATILNCYIFYFLIFYFPIYQTNYTQYKIQICSMTCRLYLIFALLCSTPRLYNIVHKCNHHYPMIWYILSSRWFLTELFLKMRYIIAFLRLIILNGLVWMTPRMISRTTKWQPCF